MNCKYCNSVTLLTQINCYCSAWCEFMDYHFHHEKEDDLEKWMELNEKMLIEKDLNIKKNKIKGFLKNNKIEKPIISKKFKSRSNPKKEYFAGIYSTFEYCDCPGFVNRFTCCHVEELKKIQKLEI